jgi:uncharacterized protein YdhG (YjbR/CyaY superfamily)
MRDRPKANTIDEYLAGLSDDKRVVLERLRVTIRAAAPGAEEFISYSLPAFRLDGNRWWHSAQRRSTAPSTR